jgi:hypothetical protein
MPARDPRFPHRAVVSPALALAFLAASRTTAAPFVDAPCLSFDTANLPPAVAVGDVNGDGKLDMVISNSGSDALTFWALSPQLERPDRARIRGTDRDLSRPFRGARGRAEDQSPARALRESVSHGVQ